MSCKNRKKCRKEFTGYEYLFGNKCGEIHGIFCQNYLPTVLTRVKEYFKDVYADLKVWGEIWL